ncbi:MAG: hypothetical protein L3J82_06885 [Planctomycetes bacterium]|nr:hypothetical protein [Planctomycetota bacterium]
MSEYKSITLETARKFIAKYRKLDRDIVQAEARRKAFIRVGNADDAGVEAAKHSEALDKQEDILFDEMRVVWMNARQTDESLPELPESWEQDASGRAIRCSYYEIEAFRGI